MTKYDIDVFHMLVGENTDVETMRYASMVLENENSPVKSNLQKMFFQSVLEKSNMNFGTIPDSRGNIKNWDHYEDMLKTLEVFANLTIDDKNPAVTAKCDIVKTSMENIASLSPNYMKGFANRNSYVMTEYNVLVLSCFNALTSIMYNHVDIQKDLKSGSYKMILTQSKGKDDTIFNNLNKFNELIRTSGMEYRRMLDNLSSSDRNNFTGVEIIGIAAVATIVFSIIPITRELLYYYYKFKNNLADSLEMQAKFLEMNRSCVEANETFDALKKKKIIERQEKLSKSMMSVSSKLRVNSVKASRESKKEITKDNKAFTIDEIKKDISNSPIELM